MLLCFGMAFVSMAIHWHSQSAMQRMFASDPPTKNSGHKPKTLGSSTSQLKSTQPNPAQFHQKPDSRQSESGSWWSRLIGVEQPSQATLQQRSTQPVGTLPSKITNQPQRRTLIGNPRNNSQQTKVVVDLNDRRVYVYRQDQVIASYPTGIGKKGWETPKGTYQVIHMEHDPIWKHPITGKIYPAGKPDSPLGARWIGFHSTQDGEIGFHGTPDEMLVGASISHGCLRMRNEDVKIFYDQVQLGTPVEVR